MRYLGLTTILTTIVLVISIYHLSFTVVMRKIDHQANKYATDRQGIINFEKKKDYLSSQKDKTYSVFKMNYTYQEVQDKALKPGLGLGGGVRIVFKVNNANLLTNLASKNNRSPSFIKALEITQKLDDIELFAKNYIKNYQKLSAMPIKRLFIDSRVQSKLSDNPTDTEVIKAIVACHQEATKANVRAYKHRLKLAKITANVISTSRGHIECEVPGSVDVKRLKAILEAPGELGIYSVEKVNQKDQINFIKKLDKAIPKDDQSTPSVQKMLIPSDYGLMFCKKGDEHILKQYFQNNYTKLLLPKQLTPILDKKPYKAENGKEFYRIYFVQKDNPILQGSEVKDARKDFGRGSYIVNITTNSKGARKLGRYTKNHIGSTILIACNNRAYTVAQISSEIPNGQCQIEGSMSSEEAQDLANVITSGVVFKADTLQQLITMPTIGKESQERIFWLFITTLLLIILFMMIYYGFGGVIASLALLANVIIVLAVLSQAHVALTWPGIAALIVSFGTGIDGNVIINESILDQLRMGKSLKKAITSGYSQSSNAIIDSTLTSIGAIIALYIFGGETLKPFATAFGFGILTSCFTSVFVSRVITEASIRVFGTNTLSFSLFKKI